MIRHTALCSICSTSLAPYRTNRRRLGADSYEVLWCGKCGIGVTDPLPTAQTLAGLYSSGSYRAQDGSRFNYFVEFLVHLFTLLRRRNIRKYRTHGAILDIGCGRGSFLEIMRREGWHVAGVEFNGETATYASGRGVPVMTPESADDLPDGSFDVITIYHVLEHVPDPSKSLRESRRLLKDGGILVIAVPNMSSIQAFVGRDKWFHLDAPYHFYHFTRTGLLRLLKDHAFTVQDVRDFSLEHGVYGWLQTLFNLLTSKNNLLYDLLKTRSIKKNSGFAPGLFDIALHMILLPLFVPLSFFLAAVEALLSRGGAIEVYAVKNEIPAAKESGR